jgi:hypothetical protein
MQAMWAEMNDMHQASADAAIGAAPIGGDAPIGVNDEDGGVAQPRGAPQQYLDLQGWCGMSFEQFANWCSIWDVVHYFSSATALACTTHAAVLAHPCSSTCLHLPHSRSYPFLRWLTPGSSHASAPGGVYCLYGGPIPSSTLAPSSTGYSSPSSLTSIPGAYALSSASAAPHGDVVTCTVSIDSFDAFILFDSGASFSFISKVFVDRMGISI